MTTKHMSRRTKLIRGINDLASVNPELAAQWHPTKNDDLTPEMVSANSKNRVWWQCEKGHEWQALVYARNQGTGCPVCKSLKLRRVIAGKTDLASVNPELAAQWHPTKNAVLTPETVTAGSNEKVWWQCEKGHEWQASVYDRNHGTGCPVCNGPKYRRVIPGKTDLASVNPEVAKQWHPTKNGDLTPKDVTAKSNQYVWWLCEEGHEWRTQVFQRHKSGCPVCARKKQAPQFFTSLSTIPELASQWHPKKNSPLTPSDVRVNSMQKVWWLCDKGHEWQATVYARKAKGTGCPHCVRRKVVPGTNDLQTLNPALAAEWHPIKNGKLLPSDVTCNSSEKVWWKCREGHEWLATIAARTRGSTCPHCLKIKKQRERKRSTALPPELIAEWHPTKNDELKPDQVSQSSRNKVWWQCAQGHEWQAPIIVRTKKGEGCPFCAQKFSQQTLASDNPNLAAEWHPTLNGSLLPSDVAPYSGRIVWWKCREGHEWQASITNRNHGSACPICRYKTVKLKDNTLADKNPQLARQWHPTKNGDRTPEQVTPNSNQKAWWVCSNGHEWEAVISSRNSGAGCPFCSNKKLLPGYNDLATIDPELAKQWHPTKNGELTPKDVFSATHKKVWWQCECGHEWEAKIINRRLGSECPICANKKRGPKKKED